MHSLTHASLVKCVFSADNLSLKIPAHPPTRIPTIPARIFPLPTPPTTRSPITPLRSTANTAQTTAEDQPTTATALAIHPAPDPHTWQSFVDAATGEWDGVTATFDRDGEPQQLPAYYVPDAYRDWGVELFDWQSQCSMRPMSSTTEDVQGVEYICRRLMPTVGCEADAVAFTEEQAANAVIIPPPTPTAAFTAQGDYSILLTFDDQDMKGRSEHCFSIGVDARERRQRVRIVQNLQRMGPDKKWKVASLEVHKERWDQPYNRRRELGGCGGGMDPFATETSTVFSSDKEEEERVMDEEVKQVLVGLPLNTWSAVKVGEDGEGVEWVAAGVVVPEAGGGGGGVGVMKMAKQNLITNTIEIIGA